MHLRMLGVVLAIVSLAMTAGTLAGEPSQKDDKGAAVRQLDLKGLRRDLPRGAVDKPTTITSVEELAKAFPEEELQARLKKEVDFKKEQLLFFAWSGSGGDKLGFKVEEGKKGPEVVFHYERGLTRDLRAHFHLFAVPKEGSWRVQGK